MKIIYVLSGKLCILFYFLGFYQLSLLAYYGGVRSHLPWLIISACLGLCFFFLSCFARKKGLIEKKKSKKQRNIEIIAIGLVSCFFIGRIVYAGMPYHGALSWKIEEWMNEREVTLKHDDLYQEGISGVLKDLDQALDLPDDLYVTHDFKITFNHQGTIENLETFLYGKDQQGKTQTYLVSYNRNLSRKMSVRMHGEANPTYQQDKRLKPFIDILAGADLREKVKTGMIVSQQDRYILDYQGKQTYTSSSGLMIVNGDARLLDSLKKGGAIKAYGASLSIPYASSQTPVTYLSAPVYVSQADVEKEEVSSQAQEAKKQKQWTTNRNDGSMLFFLNNKQGWRLFVSDAAAGSRFYSLAKTLDGGNTWKTCQEDPFQGQTGTSEGMLFFDEKLGVIGLANASQDHSSLYITRDGGTSFHEITLPMHNVKTLPATAKTFHQTIKDFDYLEMPTYKESVMKVRVMSEAGAQGALIFQSENEGKTWTYTGVSQ